MVILFVNDGFYINDLQVLIMKMLNHPNIVNLFEVIDDPNTDHFYMGIKKPQPFLLLGLKFLTFLLITRFFLTFLNLFPVLEYVEGKWVFEGAGPPGGLDQNVSRRYLRDIVSGLMYLHSHVSLIYQRNVFFLLF